MSLGPKRTVSASHSAAELSIGLTVPDGGEVGLVDIAQQPIIEEAQIAAAVHAAISSHVGAVPGKHAALQMVWLGLRPVVYGPVILQETAYYLDCPFRLVRRRVDGEGNVGNTANVGPAPDVLDIAPGHILIGNGRLVAGEQPNLG